MQVVNIHECELHTDVSAVGSLIDSLASDRDLLWPRGQWPAMRFDRPLAVGAIGGHGPIGYIVEAYQPGRMVKFRFTAPPGYHGHHSFEVLPNSPQGSILRHTIRMKVAGRARLSWLLIIRPLHDAVLEDILYRARMAMGAPAMQPQWSLWVRLLRRVRYGRSATRQSQNLEKKT